MRTVAFTFLLAFCTTMHAQKDHIIHIGDTAFEISLDEEYKVKVNGKPVKVKVMSKDTLTYEDDLFSLKYPKDYKISKMVIDEGIEQVMIMTAEGSGFLVQKYSTIDPTSLNEMMLQEVTKESMSYGYTMERADYQHKLRSGQKLEVDKAVLTYKDEANIYEIASIANKDEGILVMTMITNNSISEQGKKIIDMMWNSLEFK